MAKKLNVLPVSTWFAIPVNYKLIEIAPAVKQPAAPEEVKAKTNGAVEVIVALSLMILVLAVAALTFYGGWKLFEQSGGGTTTQIVYYVPTTMPAAVHKEEQILRTENEKLQDKLSDSERKLAEAKASPQPQRVDVHVDPLTLVLPQPPVAEVPATPMPAPITPTPAESATCTPMPVANNGDIPGFGHVVK